MLWCNPLTCLEDFMPHQRLYYNFAHYDRIGMVVTWELYRMQTMDIETESHLVIPGERATSNIKTSQLATMYLSIYAWQSIICAVQ